MRIFTERRTYPDEEETALPQISSKHEHYWDESKKAAVAEIDPLSKAEAKWQSILDVGCGVASLEWITNCKIKNQVVMTPGFIGKFDIIKNPAFLLRQPWLAKRESKVSTENQEGKVKA